MRLFEDHWDRDSTIGHFYSGRHRINYDGSDRGVPDCYVCLLEDRIAELESICENNADALAFYDTRGKRIAELEEENKRIVAANHYADTFGYRRAIDKVLALARENRCIECGGDYIIDAENVEALRGEAFKAELADSMERHKELLDRLGEAQSDGE